MEEEETIGSQAAVFLCLICTLLYLQLHAAAQLTTRWRKALFVQLQLCWREAAAFHGDWTCRLGHVGCWAPSVQLICLALAFDSCLLHVSLSERSKLQCNPSHLTFISIKYRRHIVLQSSSEMMQTLPESKQSQKLTPWPGVSPLIAKLATKWCHLDQF